MHRANAPTGYAICDSWWNGERPKLAVALLFSDIRNSQDRNINLVLSAKKKKIAVETGGMEGKRMGYVVPWSMVFVDSAIFSLPMGGYESNSTIWEEIPDC